MPESDHVKFKENTPKRFDATMTSRVPPFATSMSTFHGALEVRGPRPLYSR